MNWLLLVEWLLIVAAFLLLIVALVSGVVNGLQIAALVLVALALLVQRLRHEDV